MKVVFGIFILMFAVHFLSYGEPSMFELLASKTYAALDAWQPGR
jgi:hypothetical protein